MAILFAGSGIADFSGTTGTVTTASNLLGTGAQEAVNLGDYGQVVQDLEVGQVRLNGGFSFIHDASTNIDNVGGSGVTTNWLFRIFSSSISFTTALFQVRRYNSAGIDYLRAEYWDGAIYQTIGSDYALGELQNLIQYRVDFELIMNGSAGEFNVWFENIQTHSFTGNTIRTAATTVNRFSIHNAINNNNSASGMAVSSVILADEDTRDLYPVGLYADGNGASTDWNGDYQDIDEKGLGFDFVSSTAAEESELFVPEPIPTAFAGQRVRAVVMSTRSRHGTSGPRNMRALMRIGGITYEAVANMPLSGEMKPVQYIWETDPSTATTWPQATLNAAQFGMRSKA